MPRILILLAVLNSLNSLAQKDDYQQYAEFLHDKILYYHEDRQAASIQDWYPYTLQKRDTSEFYDNMTYIVTESYDCIIDDKATTCVRFTIVHRVGGIDSVLYEEKSVFGLRKLAKELYFLEYTWSKHLLKGSISTCYWGIYSAAFGIDYNLNLSEYFSFHTSLSYGQHEHMFAEDQKLRSLNFAIGNRWQKDVFYNRTIGIYGGPRFLLSLVSVPEEDLLLGEYIGDRVWELIPGVSLELGMHYNLGKHFYAESGVQANYWILQNNEINRAKILGSNTLGVFNGFLNVALGWRFGN